MQDDDLTLPTLMEPSVAHPFLARIRGGKNRLQTTIN